MSCDSKRDRLPFPPSMQNRACSARADKAHPDRSTAASALPTRTADPDERSGEAQLAGCASGVAVGSHCQACVDLHSKRHGRSRPRRLTGLSACPSRAPECSSRPRTRSISTCGLAARQDVDNPAAARAGSMAAGRLVPAKGMSWDRRQIVGSQLALAVAEAAEGAAASWRALGGHGLTHRPACRS